MHRLLSLVLICAVMLGGSVLIAEAKNVGKTPSASYHQYAPKPGCTGKGPPTSACPAPPACRDDKWVWPGLYWPDPWCWARR